MVKFSERRDYVLDFIEGLGFNPKFVKEIHMASREVVVTEFENDGEQKLFTEDSDGYPILRLITTQVKF